MQKEEEKSLDLVWGEAAIAKLIGRNRPQTRMLLFAGQIPGKQIGSQWVVSRQALERFFKEPSA